MSGTTLFLGALGIALVACAVNFLRTGEAWGRFNTVIQRRKFPLRFWLAVTVYAGAGIILVYQAWRRAV
jgi:hypothetical protein